MKILPYILFAFLLTSGLSSCSDWEQTVELPNNDLVQSDRIVVIEEFTGASCANCPAGLAQSAAIADLYPDNIVFIAVHSNFLGQPATKGQVDLRTPDAQALEAFLGDWLAKPEAAINRFELQQSMLFRIGSPDSWKSYVDQELKKAPEVSLKITSQFDEASRVLNVHLFAKALQDITEPLHFHCGITESKIIADQLDNVKGKLIGFEHNHVLRKILSSISGDRFAESAAKGMEFVKDYSFTLPQDSIVWKPENCNVFAFVSLDENKKYILQAAEAPVK